MDKHTAKHFQAWLERNVRADLHHDVEQAVHALLSTDPELILDHSWHELCRMAGIPWYA